MTTQWINEENYTTDENGASASHTMRGRVLESKAGPHTFQQNESYSESYQNKTENIKAETYTRTIASPQFTQSQNQLNLSVPNSMSLNASESITRTIQTRNATIGIHSMTGDSYDLQANNIIRYGGVTIIRGDYVTLCTNNLHVSAGPSAAPPVAQPRHAPPNMIAKVSGSFGSKTVSLPTVYNQNYMVQIDFTVSGDYEMESLDSVNPTTLSREGIEAALQKNLGDYFYGMSVKSGNGLEHLDQNESPTFVIGNRYGSYTLANGVAILVNRAEQIYICNYSSSLSDEKKLVDQWLLTLSGTLESKVTIARKTKGDQIEIAANNMLNKAYDFLKQHENDHYYGPVIRALRTYGKPAIQSIYNDLDFLLSYDVEDVAFVVL